MPIIRRSGHPKPKLVYHPHPNMVMHTIPVPNRLRAAQVIYDGKTPQEIPADDLYYLLRTPHDVNFNAEQVYRNRIKNRGTAIRAFCILCQGGPKAVRMCEAVTCPLWIYRLGGNPLAKKK